MTHKLNVKTCKKMFTHLLGDKKDTIWIFFLVATLVALLFQLGHFAEHIAQAVAWLGGYRDAPYMTEFGHWLMHVLGEAFYPYAGHDFQLMMGNEILHLIGNAIYAFGTVGLVFFLRTKLTIAAAIIETFHLYEHICLTSTAAMTGSPIGMSTLWGLPMDMYSSVAFRVWWHFAFNAIPTALTVIALFFVYKAVTTQKKKVSPQKK